MSLKKPVRGLRTIAASLPLKQPLTSRSKALIAAVTLVLVWIIGPHTGFRQTTDDDVVVPQSPSILDELKAIPFVKSRPKDKENAKDAVRIPAASDQMLNYADATNFCFRYHLEPYNASAPVGDETEAQHVTTPRRIYDLLLITPTTTANTLELHLASMYPYVEYFIMLEAPSVVKKTSADSSREPLSGAPRIEPPSLLDKIWQDQLSAYHAKIIRHSLSEHSQDFKDGLDHEMTTRNALFTRVIPLLTGKQRVEPGDVLLIADAEELVRPITLKVLRNCHIPERTTIRSRKYWYSYQYMKLDSPGTTPGLGEGTNQLDPPFGSSKETSAGNEWWPHPQATVYMGADTVLPDDLRKQRDQDQYIFGDGGWMCHLCDNTITETLAKLNKSGIIWADGPRWKAAGRVVDRVMKGVDLLERSNLSRIESNPDLPPYLQTNKARFHWMVDRDGPGANFIDFNNVDLEQYLAKKETVDAEADYERTNPGVAYTLENTQQPDAPASPPVDWRSGGTSGLVGLSEESRESLMKLREKASGLSEEDIGLLETLTGQGSTGSG